MLNRPGWIALVLCQFALQIAAAAGVPADLPPADDVPEEIQRLEEPGYATSTLSGEPINLGDYARLSAELQAAQQTEPQISPKLKNLIFLLKLRKFLRTFIPFF